jgi:hypothetical protein
MTEVKYTRSLCQLKTRKNNYFTDGSVLSFHRINPFLWMMGEKESRVLLGSAVVKSHYKINWTVQ